jgi:hypothetical protein
MTKIRLTNITFVNGAIEADLEEIHHSKPDPPLPKGYDTDTNVGLDMLQKAMKAHNLTPVGVQRHGDQIVAALKDTYPALDVYLSPSDAPVWPHFGSIDVTIDSGRGGWSFRPDGATPYVPKDRRG